MSFPFSVSSSLTLLVLSLSDLSSFASFFLLLLEGKIPPDEPAILPPLPIIPKVEKRRPIYGTPQSKRNDFRDRDWDRDRDFELMPPPGSHKRDVMASMDVDQPIDPNEPTYCVCHQVLLSPSLLFFSSHPNYLLQYHLITS